MKSFKARVSTPGLLTREFVVTQVSTQVLRRGTWSDEEMLPMLFSEHDELLLQAEPAFLAK